MTDFDTLRRRHDRWQQRLAKATELLKRADAAYDAHVPDDPGILSGVSGGWGKRRDALSRRQAEAWAHWDETRKKARIAESKYHNAVRDAETRKAVVIADIKPGDLVRTTSWYTVRRINAKSVTVEPAFAGMDALRFRHDQIKEVRHQ